MSTTRPASFAPRSSRRRCRGSRASKPSPSKRPPRRREPWQGLHSTTQSQMFPRLSRRPPRPASHPAQRIDRPSVARFAEDVAGQATAMSAAVTAREVRMSARDSCAQRATKPKGTYDLAVIGAAAAGFSAAMPAAELGANVALIGHGTIGGTCVNIGCVPSKTLIRAAEKLHQAQTAARFAGIRAEGRVEDWRAAVCQKDELVASLRQKKYVDLLPGYNTVAYLEGRARLQKEGVSVDGTAIKAGKLIIATGAAPALPPIPGIESVPYLTSTTALEIEQLPKSLLVIGGGYIGCELGQMFARAGVKVTIAFRSRLLPEAEPEIGTALTRYFERESIIVRGGLSYRDIRRAQ